MTLVETPCTNGYMIDGHQFGPIIHNGAETIMQPDARRRWIAYGTNHALIDLESTLSKLEAQDYWALIRGCPNDIKAITDAGQNGAIPFDVSLQSRLDTTKPTEEMVRQTNFLAAQAKVVGAILLVHSLKDLGIDVQIVSGGFIQAAEFVQSELKIPIAANQLVFEHGKFAAYNDQNILAQHNGKARYIRHNLQRGMYRDRLSMAGDGVTDMGVKSVGHDILTIGFGGVVKRDSVRSKADVTVNHLSTILPLITGEFRWRNMLGNVHAPYKRFFLAGCQHLLRGDYETTQPEFMQELTAVLRHTLAHSKPELRQLAQ